jgi:hypothetical protein
MSPTTKALLEQVASWPEQDQDELAEYAREIEARLAGVYVRSDEEWADLQEGIAQATGGNSCPMTSSQRPTNGMGYEASLHAARVGRPS